MCCCVFGAVITTFQLLQLCGGVSKWYKRSVRSIWNQVFYSLRIIPPIKYLFRELLFISDQLTKMKFIQTAILSILAFGALASATRCPKYNFKVIKGSAFSPEGLTPVVENFRKLLGGDDNGNNPPTGGKGQRSVSTVETRH